MIDSLITCLITTSPSIKHPDTAIIEGTVASIRWHLPESEILIACDGVRKEQENYRERYSEFVLRMENLCLTKWKNVRLIVQPEFLHQAQLIAKTVEQIKTPVLLFTEHDMELLPITIDWENAASLIQDGQVNLIRFMLEDGIKPEWQGFMLGPLDGFYVDVLKTVQWSQRTHLASVAYYRKMLAEHVKPADRCYLEDRFYGQCDDWEANKLTIYMPAILMARIKHTDGRGNEPKFDSILEGKE